MVGDGIQSAAESREESRQMIRKQRERIAALEGEVKAAKDEAWSAESWFLRQMKRSADPETRKAAENYPDDGPAPWVVEVERLRVVEKTARALTCNSVRAWEARIPVDQFDHLRSAQIERAARDVFSASRPSGHGLAWKVVNTWALEALSAALALPAAPAAEPSRHWLRYMVGRALDAREVNGDRRTLGFVLQRLDEYDEANPDYDGTLTLATLAETPAAEPIWPPTPDKPAPEGATFERGATLREDGCFNAYTIDVTDHGAKIVVYGDPGLRDRILRLLQNDGDAAPAAQRPEVADAD